MIGVILTINNDHLVRRPIGFLMQTHGDLYEVELNFYIALLSARLQTFKGAYFLNPLNAELNPICHLLTLLGAHPLFHISRIRVKIVVRVNYFLKLNYLCYGAKDYLSVRYESVINI